MGELFFVIVFVYEISGVEWSSSRAVRFELRTTGAASIARSPKRSRPILTKTEPRTEKIYSTLSIHFSSRNRPTWVSCRWLYRTLYNSVWSRGDLDRTRTPSWTMSVSATSNERHASLSLSNLSNAFNENCTRYFARNYYIEHQIAMHRTANLTVDV